MRYMIMMGTIDDLHYVGEGESLPDALINLLGEVLYGGDEDEIADLSNGLEALEIVALVEAIKEAANAP